MNISSERITLGQAKAILQELPREFIVNDFAKVAARVYGDTENQRQTFECILIVHKLAKKGIIKERPSIKKAAYTVDTERNDERELIVGGYYVKL